MFCRRICSHVDRYRSERADLGEHRTIGARLVPARGSVDLGALHGRGPCPLGPLARVDRRAARPPGRARTAPLPAPCLSSAPTRPARASAPVRRRVSLPPTSVRRPTGGILSCPKTRRARRGGRCDPSPRIERLFLLLRAGSAPASRGGPSVAERSGLGRVTCVPVPGAVPVAVSGARRALPKTQQIVEDVRRGMAARHQISVAARHSP